MSNTQSGVVAPRTLRAGCDMARATTALLGLSAAMLMPGLAFAQSQPQDAGEAPLATMTVEDTAIDPNPNAQLGVPFKARTSGDDRHSRPLAETPATISVLTRAQIEQSGYTDLTRILDAQPGVTVGTGENGNAFGDRYIIRGQEAKSDVFVDGLRDPGMTIRESFAIEQIEISKGPNSSFGGRGSSGGAINAITKQATTDFNFAKASVGVGTDAFIRATADINYSTGNSFAIRANALYAKTDVPDRGPADRERKGLAVSALYAPTDDLKITLDYYGLRADDNPDLGGFLVTDAAGERVPGPVLPVYAQDTDFLKSDVDTFTARINYSFSPDVRISNLTRYGTSYNQYVNSGIGLRTTSAFNATGIYNTGGIDNGHSGWQDVKYIANQTNLYVDANLLGAKHQLIVGMEYTKHDVDSGNFTLTRTGTRNCRVANSAGANDQFCITDASGNAVPNLGTLLGQTSVRSFAPTRKWGISTISGYLMDTVDLAPALTLFAGVRLDHYDFELDTLNGATGVNTASYRYTDALWNGHLGLTYKVGGGGMFYASVATAADINGGEPDSGTSAGYGGLVLFNGGAAPARPERSWNFEIGTKWNILGEKLLLTAAVFQAIKSDVMEGVAQPPVGSIPVGYDPAGTLNTGKNRVQGFEFSIAGNITDRWSVQGGFTAMNAKILESFTPANVGKTLTNFANTQAEFMTRYQVTDKFAIGAAVKYKSRRYGGQPDTAAVFTPATATGTDAFAYSQPVPAYAVADLSVEYKFTNNIDLRLNVNNLFDKDYYLAVYRAGFFLYKGDARQIVATLNVNF